MAIRRIFVDPGDRVEVYVMRDKDVPKNLKEWNYTIRPFMFSFRPQIDKVIFEDPGLDIRRTKGGAAETDDGYKVEE